MKIELEPRAELTCLLSSVICGFHMIIISTLLARINYCTCASLILVACQYNRWKLVYVHNYMQVQVEYLWKGLCVAHSAICCVINIFPPCLKFMTFQRCK